MNCTSNIFGGHQAGGGCFIIQDLYKKVYLWKREQEWWSLFCTCTDCTCQAIYGRRPVKISLNDGEETLEPGVLRSINTFFMPSFLLENRDNEAKCQVGKISLYCNSQGLVYWNINDFYLFCLAFLSLIALPLQSKLI